MKTNCNCHFCGKPIYKTPNQLKKYKKHFCDNRCASKSRIMRITKQCIVCGSDVTRKPSEFSENVYCSRKCYHVSRKAEFTNKSSKREYACSYCARTFKRHPSQVKNKKHIYCNMVCKDKHNGELIRGSNHPRWNPELTEEDRRERRKNRDYIDWRESVYRRDDYTCQCCGDDKGGNLVAHHILNFSEHENLRLDIDNGITLCGHCHKEFHDEYGYTQNDKQQLEEFIQRHANQLPITLVTV